MGCFMRKLGIILAGGKSTRLYPSTLVTTKQLLPVYDKPLIYYPLTTMMLAGIRDIIIISSTHEKERFKELFSNCKTELGIDVKVLEQKIPLGIADAFNIVREEMGNDFISMFDRHVLILGDNIFYGAGFSDQLLHAGNNTNAHIFLHTVADPERFGVAELGEDNVVLHVEEKPKSPRSNLAITGLYFYPQDIYERVKSLQPSARGELEITDVNDLYLRDGKLFATKLQRGMVWFDAGTPDALLESSNFIKFIQSYQSILIGSPHEISIRKKWVTQMDITGFLSACKNTQYGKYLINLFDNESRTH